MAKNGSVLGGDYVLLEEDFIDQAGGTLPGLWGTTDVSSAGSPTLDFVDDIGNGEFAMTHDLQDELQTMLLSCNDSTDFHHFVVPTKAPIFEARVKRTSATPSADQRVIIGLMGTYNATWDTTTHNVWFRMDGANNNILIEGDDGTTNTDDIDTGIDWVSGTYQTFVIDMTDTANVKFSIDGVDCAQTIDVSALAATDELVPVVGIQKDAGAETDSVTVDYIKVRWER